MHIILKPELEQGQRFSNHHANYKIKFCAFLKKNSPLMAHNKHLGLDVWLVRCSLNYRFRLIEGMSETAEPSS